MILDNIHNLRSYMKLHPGIEAGIAALRQEKVLSLPEGRHELDGKRLIALPQSYITRSPELCRWESHRKYIDIQYLQQGREGVGWCHVKSLSENVPFDDEKDVAFYTGTGPVIEVPQGCYAVFFPEDGHMPCQALAGQPGPVRKIVMKVAVDW